MASHLSAPYFHNEEAAYAFVEARLWPNGAVCPHCGEAKRVGKMGGEATRIGKMGGEATRIGAHKCYACRKQFTVKIGTVFESSHVPLHQWLQAFYLMCGSKKGISSNQLHRILGVTLKTAWFMSHRIREAMRDGAVITFGSEGGAVEADETFIGREPGEKGQKAPHSRGFQHKMKVLSLVDRESGQARSFVVDHVDTATLMPIVKENVAKEARLMTDDGRWYYPIGREFAEHQAVFHGRDEYVRGEAHTNTVEGFFSIFKRGTRGIHQHCGKQHLHRYLAEFDFRYSNRLALGIGDSERADIALMGVKGKRLTYQTARV